jgi:RNA polymerase sigma-70 factor (ECF subfamily)
MNEVLVKNWCELQPSEVRVELNSLTDGQKTALIKIARHYLRRTAWGYLSYEDLIHEAYSRVLASERKWPRGAPAVTFLGGVMRSIASEWKLKKRNEWTLDEVMLSDEEAEARGAMARLDIEKILSLFDDDPIARKLAEGMMVGATAEELQAECGLSQTEYESKRKKIRRRIEKLQGV